MADLSRRGDYTPRRVREQRAYRLAMVGGTAGVVTVVTGVLAILGIMSFGFPILSAIIAVVCFLLFRRLVSR
jgi:uncharacterized membrane protein YsdA (DUF1294 family)